MAQPVLLAALKPSAATSYPYLPARMWTSAHRLAELVAKYRGIPVETVNCIDRVLSARDFMFRDAVILATRAERADGWGVSSDALAKACGSSGAPLSGVAHSGRSGVQRRPAVRNP